MSTENIVYDNIEGNNYNTAINKNHEQLCENYLMQAINISKKYKSEQALSDVSIKIESGQILGFLGPSGSGKTTTIKIITGQLRQTSGTAYLLGKDTRELDESVYKQIGIVSDNSGIYKKLTVYDNLLYFSKILGVDKKKIDELLDRVQLIEHKNKKAGVLSKGQLQRLIFARAIMHSPKVLILDEPTSGLDPATSLAIHELLLDLKKNGMGILLTTHNMDEAEKLCDEVSLLNDGRIVETGSPQEICLKYNNKKCYKILLKDKQELILKDNLESLECIKKWFDDSMIETIHSCEPTLEDVFITITGKELGC